MHSLRVIAKVSKKSVTQIIEPHKDLLADYVPLRKHNIRHQPVYCQIGILDGNTFCITLEPRLFSYGTKLFYISFHFKVGEKIKENFNKRI